MQRPKEAVHSCKVSANEKAASKLRPRPVSRKTSVVSVKNYCCLRRHDEFQEF